jgi:enoyl-CoA hydratase/carnithine racemase
LIRWEVRGPVGLATLDRPDRRNALSVEMCHQLREHLIEHQDLRGVVITGAGSAFCAGADLGNRLAHGEDEFRPAFEPLLDEVVAFPAPVIAAVNGPALGGGTQLVVACDLRVAAPGASFGIPAAQLGVMLAPENIQRLALLVGQAHARDLLLTGRRIDVDEAVRMGLVQRRADDALAAGLALATEIAALAPLSVSGHKSALNAVARHTGYARGEDGAVLDELDALVRRAFASDDLKEGLAAFADKRRPDFTGR